MIASTKPPVGLAAVVLVATLLIGVHPSAGAGDTASQLTSPDQQHSRLLDRRVLPAATSRAGSAPTGAFFSSANAADAARNGVADELPDDPAYLAHQPVQGFSGMIPAGDGTWWALSDNGFGARDNSADYELVVYRVQPNFGASTPAIVQTITLRDPDRHVPWQLVCDRTGAALPDLSINVLPASAPPVCGNDPAARTLTGFDFDPESIQIDGGGDFWIGEEFGPFLLHTDITGRLLEPPISVPGVKAPQNPMLNVGVEAPNVATSRGLEGLAVSPDRKTLYPLLEGAVGDDHAQDVRLYTFDISKRQFEGFVRLRLEMPGAKANLTVLRRADGTPAYPGAIAPSGTGGQAHGEITAMNSKQLLFIERDGEGDGLNAPRFKKVFLIDISPHATKDGYVDKQILVDLLAVPDPARVGGDGDYFRFPFITIENVHVVDEHTILVACDNNYPFSNGRSRSRSVDRTGPLAPGDTEIILLGLGTKLDVNKRLLTPG